jgi:hypothetical protein
VAGFFVIPVIGAPSGGAAGIDLAWYARLREPRAALAARRPPWSRSASAF